MSEETQAPSRKPKDPRENQKILEKTKRPSRKPKDLLNDNLVEQALKEEYGENVIYKTYEVEDFTKKGDNYASVVTGVRCHASLNGEDFVAKYVAKLNPCRSFGGFQHFLNEMFKREGTFLKEIVPIINDTLKSAGTSLDCFPKCLATQYDLENEVLINKDLRPRGFRMFDRRKGMADAEALLAIKALAKLHASSYLVKCQNNASLAEAFPFVKDNMFGNELDGYKLFSMMISSSLDQCAEMLEHLEDKKYDISHKWLKTSKDEIRKSYFEMMNPSPDAKFDCLCHGDFWNNNMLFRYDADNNPVEIALLDLQICRIGSIGTDMNYFLFSSLNGDDRKRNLSRYQDEYYKVYQHIAEAGGLEMPFTMQEFVQEYNRVKLFGALAGFILTPIILAEAEDLEKFDVDKITDENLDEFIAERKEDGLKKMTASPAFKARFLAIFDDLGDIVRNAT